MAKLATTELIRIFDIQQDWEIWLNKNHETSSVIWLQLAKKGTDIVTIS